MWFTTAGSYYNTWTCSENDCGCEGPVCIVIILIISTEVAVSDLPSISDCKYGDTVKFERPDGGGMNIFELAIVGKAAQGKFRIQLPTLHDDL